MKGFCTEHGWHQPTGTTPACPRCLADTPTVRVEFPQAEAAALSAMHEAMSSAAPACPLTSALRRVARANQIERGSAGNFARNRDQQEEVGHGRDN